jgi:catechol 2,3-dioxygenase-like lactoylglutathione lyase family enzyme
MPYKFSKCIAFHTTDYERAIEFYQNVFGFTIVESHEGYVEVEAGQNRLFLAKGDSPGKVHELIVPDLEAARDELVAEGCEVVRWEGKGKDCYIRDPFGFMFNLWEDAEAFGNKEHEVL